MALPVKAPAMPEFPIAAVKGRSLLSAEDLSRIIRRNHITGGAFFLESVLGSMSVFSSSVHTRLIPDENTYFRVASVTKMATALLAFRLMDLGFLDLSERISSLLPDGDKVPELKGILVSHLLSHTSGLKDPANLEQLLISRKPYSAAVSGCRVSEPGEVFLYSNLGFGLLGCIFESVLRKPVPLIYQEFLFSPLGMNASLEGCSLPEERIMPVIRILPFRENSGLTLTELGKSPLPEPDPFCHYGHTAGSMYTDLFSLAKMVRCIRDDGKPLLSSAYAGSMKKKVSSYGSLSPTLSYGSGLLIINDPRISGSTVYGHQGFAYGCVDGAFWEDSTGQILLSLNGGCSEARTGKFSLANLDLCRWAFRKELPSWK